MNTGEFELIEKIQQRARFGTGLALGIGDDCSALEVPPGHQLLTSTDLLLEDVHFCLDWTDLHSLGVKAVAVNISDIAAMGAQPRCLHLGLGLPGHFSDEQVAQFLDGFFAGLETYDVLLAGGDTCQSNGPLMISVTVQGFCRNEQLVTRDAAVIGEDLWVSGSLGDSALALKRLRAGQPLSPFLAQRHFRPQARMVLGRKLGTEGLATAMLDLSDGLSGDLQHLLHSSGVGADIELERLPLSEEFSAALRGDQTLRDLALSGGEDYELLFSAKAEVRDRLKRLSEELQISLSRIGTLTQGTQLCFSEVDGQRYHPQLKPFDHFSPSR